jgi:hypothetical protein
MPRERIPHVFRDAPAEAFGLAKGACQRCKTFHRLFEEIQLAPPGLLDAIKSKPIHLHHRVDIPALTGKYQLQLGAYGPLPVRLGSRLSLNGSHIHRYLLPVLLFGRRDRGNRARERSGLRFIPVGYHTLLHRQSGLFAL